MAKAGAGFSNRVRDERVARNWSQRELAARAGLSRAEVSAIETGRLVPSTSAALGLARALGAAVESLFRLAGGAAAAEPWAWPPGRERRFWLASVGDRVLRFPVEPTAAGVLAHDGVVADPSIEADAIVSIRTSAGRRGSVGRAAADPDRTLVVAGCDPAIGLVSGALSSAGVRVLPLLRSSGRALDLLRDDRVHVAGVHLGDDAAGNDAVVRSRVGPGYRCVRVARWQEGLALSPGLGHRTIGSAVTAALRWVGRDEGSGARRLQDRLLAGRTSREARAFVASDHRGVVETIRTGWAQAGVCVELAAVEGGLEFLPLHEEDYDLVFSCTLEDDPRIVALIDVLRGRSFARLLSALPGYDASRTGDLS